MRYAAALLGFSVALAAYGTAAGAMGVLPNGARAAATAPLVRVEYYCSPGFEATVGGRCVATASADQVDLYLNEPAGDGYDEPVPLRRHHRHRKGLHARY